MNDRQRLEAIVAVVCKYLPPDGISREDAMREIISLVDPLPEQEPLDWLPKHAAGLYITHNDHKSVYESIDDHYDYLDNCEWVSPEEKLKAIELNSVWELHWYPDTPIGSYKVVASSLEAIQKHMKEHGDAYR
jgi:hypothetical protein